MLTEYTKLIFAAPCRRPSRRRCGCGGPSVLSRAGVAGIILGVLANIDPQTLTAVVVIAFGGCP